MRLQQAATGGPDAQSLVKMVVLVDAPTGSSTVFHSQLPRMPFFFFASLTSPDRLIGGKVDSCILSDTIVASSRGQDAFWPRETHF